MSLPEPELPELVLLGGGGLARETLGVVQAVNAAGPSWRLRGLLDDNPALAGSAVSGMPVLGGTGTAADLPAQVRFLATVASSADPGRRLRLVDRVGLGASRWATLVHPSCALAPSVTVGAGSVLLAAVVATADVSVGRHVVIMPGCVLTHDDVLADGCTLASGVRLSGGVSVGEGAYLGTGALVREGLVVGAGAVVGMGAVVTRDVPAGEVWAGVPARRLR